ncbi:gluconokinase [Lichenihabitans psoromatis]|uniref:gluconokinase n=1 Tax=Lichenihabitans psoromatis TaxID=2528642 RepID=UPI001036BC4F|nr:gluconokinase [Lichenihabitans psoromatis]
MTDTDTAKPRLALIVMGVSGSGKTTIGALLAGLLDLDFVDGDDLHPPSNVEKMHAGHPLTDADRWPWLDTVGATLADAGAHPRGIVIACSALRRVYRDRIRAKAGAALRFVFLDIETTEVERRMAVRLNHFMPASLVASQFATLERPVDEADVVTVSDRGGGPADAARSAAAMLAGVA